MSLSRYANRRDGTEGAIVDALIRAGAQVERMDQPCDLLVRFGGRVHLLECEGAKRTGTGTRQEKQVEFLRTWEVPIVKTPLQALEAVGAYSPRSTP